MENLAFVVFAQALSGLTRAMILFLVSSGLSLVFGIMGVLNFAHGSFYMLGAFITYWLWLHSLLLGFGFWVSVFFGALVVSGIGFIIELLLLRRTYDRGHVSQLLLTYALTLIVSDLVRMVWGGRFYTIPPPGGLDGAVEVFGLNFPTYNLFIIILGIAIFAFLWVLIYRTGLGRIIRAAVFDREVVSCLGIPIPGLFGLVFVLGMFLAGLAGGISTPLTTIDIGMDVSMLIEAFAVVIIGGVGNLTGTLLGALIVGLIHAFGILVFPQVTLALIFFVMAIVLIVRPYGLLGKTV
jgi:branched-subunit amino acid ABC-type transport system permease component